MRRIGALLATLLAAPVANAAPTTPKVEDGAARWGQANVRTTVRGSQVHAVVDYRRGGKVVAVMPVPARCSARQAEKLVARELLQNLDAFWTVRNITINLPGSTGFGTPNKAGTGKRRSGTKKGSTSDVKDLQGMIRDVLAGGKRNKGTNAKSGETCFDGYNLDVGKLVEHNNSLATGNAKSSTVKSNSGSIKYTEHADGTSTVQTFDANGKLIKAESVITKGDVSIYHSADYETGEATVAVTKTTDEGSSSVSTTSGPKGTSTTHTKTVGKGSNETKVSVTNNHDKNGKHKGGKVTVESDGKKTTGTIAADANKDVKVETGKKDDKGTGKKDDTFKLESADLAKIRMPSGENGFANLPPVCISDEMMASLLNWNRLQNSVVNPSPIAGSDTDPGVIKTQSPCSEDQDKDLDLNPAYLRPDKQGWITDPTPHAAKPSSGR